jgi:hypothetical protein
MTDEAVQRGIRLESSTLSKVTNRPAVGYAILCQVFDSHMALELRAPAS